MPRPKSKAGLDHVALRRSQRFQEEPHPPEPSPFQKLPTEIIEHIFHYLSFQNIAHVRLVCKRFDIVASSILNNEFNNLRTAMQLRFQTIKSQMPRRESARRKHPLARESDIIETLHMRLTLLQMTYGKHIERMHCCFFAGEILDEVHRILQYVKSSAPNLNRAYKVTDELFDLSTMAMEYFKERVEPTLPEITYFATDLMEYTPSLSSSPKTQLSLLESPSTSQTVSSSSLKPMSSSLSSPEDSSITVHVNRRLRKIRENMKRNTRQSNTMRRDLMSTNKKVLNHTKQIEELKAHLDDYDRKFQTTSKKINAVLQDLGRCKTELAYWRSKSPASSCGGKVTPITDLVPLNEDLILMPNLEDSEDFKPIPDDQPSTSFCYLEHEQPISPFTLSLSSFSNSCKSDSNPPSKSTALSEKLAPRACKRKLELDSTMGAGGRKKTCNKRMMLRSEDP